MELIAMARELGKRLQQSDEYKIMLDAKMHFEQDEELQKQIGEFNLKKMDLNQQIGKGENKDQDKISQLDKEIRALYQQIMTSPNMQVYSIAQKTMDDILNQIATILSMSASGEDPESIDLSARSCGGNCSGCAGCH